MISTKIIEFCSTLPNHIPNLLKLQSNSSADCRIAQASFVVFIHLHKRRQRKKKKTVWTHQSKVARPLHTSVNRARPINRPRLSLSLGRLIKDKERDRERGGRVKTNHVGKLVYNNCAESEWKYQQNTNKILTTGSRKSARSQRKYIANSQSNLHKSQTNLLSCLVGLSPPLQALSHFSWRWQTWSLWASGNKRGKLSKQSKESKHFVRFMCKKCKKRRRCWGWFHNRDPETRRDPAPCPLSRV